MKYVSSMIKPMNSDFIFENYHKRTGFVKGSSYYSMKSLKKRFVIACNYFKWKNS